MNHDEFLTLCKNAEKALQEAADGVVEEAIRTHGSVIVWENGAVREIFWNELLEERRKAGERHQIERKPGNRRAVRPHPNPLPEGEGTEQTQPSP
jgi:hypothetical protein